jgi:caffeoyl-CoA O-methyltransferase
MRGQGHQPPTTNHLSDRTGEYISALFAPEDALLVSLREEADRTGMPPIAVSADEGRLLQVLLTSIGARRVLEVGTLGGYSAIWMARALPEDGELVSIEMEPKHAEFARRYIERAGLNDRVEIRLGRALEVLPSLDGERFDAMFIDADKEPMPTYFEWALRLVRPGGLVIADNTLWGGKVFDEAEHDEKTRAVREFNRRMATDPRILSILVPTHDGVSIGVVRP